MPRRKKVRTTISLLRRPKKCLRRASHFLEFFRFFRGNMLHLRLISAHLRCQKDAGFLAARKCVCGFVSLQLFSSHLNPSEPNPRKAKGKAVRDNRCTASPFCFAFSLASRPIWSHTQKKYIAKRPEGKNKANLSASPWSGEMAFPALS